MSRLPGNDPECPDSRPEALETLIVPRARDIGGFDVRRVLPSRERQMVGSFIFFDQMGPADLLTTQSLDVRPHPHIGLATVTYLLEGTVRHRDSLGTDQVIRPGEVNWMIAGRGITHSERTPDELRGERQELFGIQTWVALPERDEDSDPSFQNSKREELPFIEDGGSKVRLVLGSAYGERAPVQTFAEMFYADVHLDPAASIPIPDEHEDRGAYILEGAVEIDGHRFDAHQMLVFRPDRQVTIRATDRGARLMLLGGETLEGPRYIWWNFVSSSEEKIEAAKEAWKKADWENGPFQLPPGDDEEYVPL